MNNSLSPYDMAGNMATHIPNSHTAHRTPRSSSSQSGHPYRVEKPRSIHNSPRTVERRKTTTGAKLYATLDDHYNMMMGITGDEDAIESTPEPSTTRPMSWHPTSTQWNTQHQSTMFDPSHHDTTSSHVSNHGSDFYSLSSRNSMAVDTSQSYQNYTSNHDAHRSSQDSKSSWQTQHSCASSSFSTPATETMPWYLQEWARKNQDQVVPSQHGSTEFLPIQHAMEPEDEQVDESMEDSGRELIGMGLYDLPDSALDWSSPLGEATGKGLKLEETWQPPSPSESDDDDENEDDEQDDDTSSDGEEEEEELPSPPAPAAPVAPAKTPPHSAMEGTSFFFDEDDTIAKEWWYQHLKQPSLPVRDAGYGYGWL